MERIMSLKSYQQALVRALDWFSAAEVDRWNFAVLTERGMLGHERARDRDEVFKCSGWGWVKNGESDGRNIYMRPAKGSSWPIVFLDDIGPRTSLGIARKYAALVVETSLNNCQVWVKCNRALDEASRCFVQRSLATKIGADAHSVSGDHFGRAPGYKNRKPGRNAFTVNILSSTDGSVLHVSPYLLSGQDSNVATRTRPSLTPPLRGRVRSHSPGPNAESESENEFRFCLARFRWALEKSRDPHGEVEFLMQNLLERAIARGKRSPDAYASTTVSKALASVLRRPPS